MGREKAPGLVSAWSAWPPLASGEVRVSGYLLAPGKSADGEGLGPKG